MAHFYECKTCGTMFIDPTESDICIVCQKNQEIEKLRHALKKVITQLRILQSDLGNEEVTERTERLAQICRNALEDE